MEGLKGKEHTDIGIKGIDSKFPVKFVFPHQLLIFGEKKSAQNDGSLVRWPIEDTVPTFLYRTINDKLRIIAR